jgi:predicted  nucleic acid-binding Zn-ribbon protein
LSSLFSPFFTFHCLFSPFFAFYYQNEKLAKTLYLLDTPSACREILLMESLSIRIITKRERKPISLTPIHDLRLYTPESLPDYINPEKTHLNRILFAYGKLPRTKEEAKEWVKALEEENKQIFKRLKEEGAIPKNQGYKISSPIVEGILTLSHEAQRKLREDNTLFNKFLEYATEYLQLLARALGTDLLYAVVHLDEYAPHLHFTLRSISYKDPDPEAFKRLGWGDLFPSLSRTKGKSVISLFYSGKFKDGKRDYQIPIERLQDSLEFFRPRIGFGRGVRKKERMARGEPYWKVVYRSVKQLHEDLPKEIKLAEERLSELYRQIGELERRYDELMEEIQELEKKKAQLSQEVKAVEKRWEEATAKVNELEKEKVILEREVLITQMKIKIFEHDLQITEERLKELNEEVRKYETMIQDRKREYEEARKKREELSKEIERLKKVKDELERQTKAKEKELLELSEQLREAQKLAEKVKENELKLLVELQKALEENERLKEENLRLKNRIAKLETENEELKRELYGRDYGLGR